MQAKPTGPPRMHAPREPVLDTGTSTQSILGEITKKVTPERIILPTWCDLAKISGLGLGFVICSVAALVLFPITIGVLIAEGGMPKSLLGSILGAPLLGMKA